MIRPFMKQALLGGLTLCTMAVGLVTADVTPPIPDEERLDEASPASSYEEEVEVSARRPDPERAPLDMEVLESGRAPNIAVALETVPGLSGVRRSLGAYEPVVHGLGWERVQTELDGMPLYGACPARMDPPAFILAAAAAEEVSVVKGLASVSLGPGGTGGRVRISTDYDRGLDPEHEFSPWVRFSYCDGGKRLRGGAGVKGGTDSIDYSVGLEALDQDDYRSGDGTSVPASQRESGGFFSFGHRIGRAHRWSLGAIYQEGEGIDYPSLPMDTDSSESTFYRAGYSFEPKSGRGALSSLELSLAASDLDHVMSNRGRTNRGILEAESVSEALTRSARLTTDWKLPGRSLLVAGLDLNSLERDALRERYIVASDRTFYDHLWPDVSQDDLGLFAEYLFATDNDWSFRFGLRYDDIRSEAGAADDPALGGGTIREAYVGFYGPEAALTNRSESLLTGNAVFSKPIGKRVVLQGGLGLAGRAAGLTERYFAFALSPMGYQVGNPALRAEEKLEFSLGASLKGRRWEGSVSGYHYAIDDYILPVILAERDVNNDDILDLIRGFENTDATLTGLDLSFVLRPSERWILPVSLFYVRGEDDSRGVPLPEIPPLELRLAVRHAFAGRLLDMVELGGRFVDRAERINPSFPENETAGFAVWHLRASFDLSRSLALDFGVENLLDKEYVEHLTREAAGNLPGFTLRQEIPQPGRFFTAALRGDF
jgi:iron complex outermembrane receptor protein